MGRGTTMAAVGMMTLFGLMGLLFVLRLLGLFR